MKDPDKKKDASEMVDVDEAGMMNDMKADKANPHMAPSQEMLDMMKEEGAIEQNRREKIKTFLQKHGIKE